MWPNCQTALCSRRELLSQLRLGGGEEAESQVNYKAIFKIETLMFKVAVTVIFTLLLNIYEVVLMLLLY